MSSASYCITPQQLWSRIGTADAPMILDLRRRAIYDALFAWLRHTADERQSWPAKTVEKAA